MIAACRFVAAIASAAHTRNFFITILLKAQNPKLVFANDCGTLTPLEMSDASTKCQAPRRCGSSPGFGTPCLRFSEYRQSSHGPLEARCLVGSGPRAPGRPLLTPCATPEAARLDLFRLRFALLVGVRTGVNIHGIATHCLARTGLLHTEPRGRRGGDKRALLPTGPLAMSGFDRAQHFLGFERRQ